METFTVKDYYRRKFSGKLIKKEGNFVLLELQCLSDIPYWAIYEYQEMTITRGCKRILKRFWYERYNVSSLEKALKPWESKKPSGISASVKSV